MSAAIVRYPDGSPGTLGTFLTSVPSGAVVDIAPGTYVGPVDITRPITLRGAGELTRIVGGQSCRPMTVSIAEGTVVLDSIRLEDGRGDDGGGLAILRGDVRLRNIHIHRCSAQRGGALAVVHGRVRAKQLKTVQTDAQRGGALWVGNEAQLSLQESQLLQGEATFGGAIAVEGGAQLDITRLTVRRARARSAAGGQALYAAGAEADRPRVRLSRVRFEDSPMGLPVVVDADSPAELRLEACDVPRSVRTVAGLVDGGANHWR